MENDAIEIIEKMIERQKSCFLLAKMQYEKAKEVCCFDSEIDSCKEKVRYHEGVLDELFLAENVIWENFR